MRRYLYRFEAMTTPCELQIFCQTQKLADRSAKKVLEEAKRLEKKYNFFNPSSYLSAINQREECELDQETRSLLQSAKHYYRLTDGLFDITLGTIKNLYRSSISVTNLEKEKERLACYIGCEHFRLKKSTIYFDNPYTKIDLGGFIKEYAVDKAAKILKKSGIRSALINFGGDIYAIGKKPDSTPYLIGLKSPRNPQLIIEKIPLTDQALTTSGSYERQHTVQGQHFSHILNKTSETALSHSVTTLSHSCLESGVFSTSLCIDPTLSPPGNMQVYIHSDRA